MNTFTSIAPFYNDCDWQIELLHLGLAVIMDEGRDITERAMMMRWPDGVWRLTYIMWAAYLADQQEMDKVCCESSQKCKQCVAPKNRLHEAFTVWARRKGKDVEKAVRDAFAGKVPGGLGPRGRRGQQLLAATHRPLFTLGTDARSKRPRWLPTAACTTAAYERTRTALGGIHLVENGLWRNRHYDYLMLALKDPMHGNEHGNSMLVYKCTIRSVREFELAVGAPQGSIVKVLHRRLLIMCESSTVQHVTLLTLGSQRILDEFEGLNKEMRTKKKRAGPHVVDAGDVAKLLLVLPFVLEGLGHEELERYNSRQGHARDRVKDPFRPIIGAINEYLHAYHMYRAEALTVPEITTLDTKSRQALHTLQTVFPFYVTLQDGTRRSLFCTEKPHSITHWADTYYTIGRCRTASTQVTETRMKSAVKTKAKNTNNQASFGMSLLKHNQNVEAAIELSRHLDEKGVGRVWNGLAFFWCWFAIGFTLPHQ